MCEIYVQGLGSLVPRPWAVMMLLRMKLYRGLQGGRSMYGRGGQQRGGFGGGLGGLLLNPQVLSIFSNL